jgi:hypothetical protein
MNSPNPSIDFPWKQWGKKDLTPHSDDEDKKRSISHFPGYLAAIITTRPFVILIYVQRSIPPRTVRENMGSRGRQEDKRMSNRFKMRNGDGGKPRSNPPSLLLSSSTNTRQWRRLVKERTQQRGGNPSVLFTRSTVACAVHTLFFLL